MFLNRNVLVNAFQRQTLFVIDFVFFFFFFGGEGFFFSYNFFLFFSIILSLIRRWEWCGSGGEEKQCVIWMES